MPLVSKIAGIIVNKLPTLLGLRRNFYK